MTAETLEPRADAGRLRSAPVPLLVSLALSVVLAVVAVLWWVAYAPLVEVDPALGGLLTASGTAEYDGALVMPMMVCAALVAASTCWAVGRGRAGHAGRAAVLMVVVLLAALLLDATAIDRVAGEMETSAPDDIAGMPFAPMGIGLWAVVLATVTALVSLGAIWVRAGETSLVLIGCIVVGFGTLAAELVRLGDGRASDGFAAISAAAGLWLACTVWALRRGRQTSSERAPSVSPAG
ncbi:MAG: hypothetical protein JHD16_04845 [Solirubrobacteraceae bacterium]|nr:hypothetical protein [Solirubrobacteraceae bacterium]